MSTEMKKGGRFRSRYGRRPLRRILGFRAAGCLFVLAYGALGTASGIWILELLGGFKSVRDGHTSAWAYMLVPAGALIGIPAGIVVWLLACSAYCWLIEQMITLRANRSNQFE
jgi:hypothetical protein